MFAVEVYGLWKMFGSIIAVKDLTFNVMEGEIFGLIGPNGAGKTTTLRILATLIKPTKGKAKVYGLDVVEDSERVRERPSRTLRPPCGRRAQRKTGGFAQTVMRI